MQTRRNKNGFTLVELLVVIAIIGILVGLLLPAVQAAREAARRMQCSNNLKQLGLALHNYESTYKKFPAGRFSLGGLNSSSPASPYLPDPLAKNGQGLTSLLPFMEQQPLYDQFNHSCAYGDYIRPGGAPLTTPNAVDSGNAALSEILVTSFRCPSDGGAETIELSGYYSPDRGAGVAAQKTNYDFLMPASTLNSYNYHRGVSISTRYLFGENSYTPISGIQDGTSNTLAMGELTLETFNGDTSAWSYAGWLSVGIDPVGAFNSTFPARGLNVWNYGNNSSPLNNKRGRRASWYSVASLHPGGCMFVLADGSVRYISETIDTTNLTNLSRMADGQVIDADF
ncbi:Type II secretion system protein G precursor [Rosistilla oblonga]|uniref:DUF1559 domain-containing protein n=1 Tax=Rosistilla oblonga TaxID=2527990 RepID=UPI0011896BD5|nr:DUF1559 domain-containing protein [Rosistilla oblonga]QDV11543.1 Type II secretion system protein G precursor [Rosistilla oblonga]